MIQIGVKMEWQGRSGWMMTYLQHNLGHDFRSIVPSGVPDAYLSVSRLDSVIRGYIYESPSEDRGCWAPPRVLDVSFDNLERTLSILERRTFASRPEPRKIPVGIMRQNLLDLGFRLTRDPTYKPKNPKKTRVMRCNTCVGGVSLSTRKAFKDIWQ